MSAKSDEVIVKDFVEGFKFDVDFSPALFEDNESMNNERIDY